jgi:uncharacterized protein (TIGR03435 family)
VDLGLRISGSQVRITAMSLKDYIGLAYAVKPFQIMGPEWLAQLRFDVAGKIPDGESAEKVNVMLQTLLADRFALELHRERRELPVYALTARDGGPKVTESAPLAENPPPSAGHVDVAASGTGRTVALDLGGGSSFNMANNRIEIRRMTMADAAEILERFVDRPVMDTTGLNGRYDLTLELTQEDYMVMLIRGAVNGGMPVGPQALRVLEGAPGDTLSGPLQKYGLKLDARRMPLEVLVVDAMRRTPTDN